MANKPYSRILVANRGEIAVRIIRACRNMGIETVAVYSTADANSLHRRMADISLCIGPPSPTESYLNIPAIMSAAEITDVDAIHPGYGFLAENSHFVDICKASNIDFIGPSAESMNMLGDKAMARKLAGDANVPITPGSDGCIDDENEALEVARRLGYPVLIKATAGGGGRGIRVAYNDLDFRNGFAQARHEALIAFGNGDVYVEKFLENPRHVEVQIMADKFGNVVSIGERDCSLQRRNQKLIEESPSTVVDDKLRNEMGEASIRLAKAAKYHGAGTIEFLVDKKKNFYFMEMNTRIQVEHTVTEVVSGIDLVKEMILCCSGKKLSFKQKDVELKGHAIECRINAEDPDRGFAPCPGKISLLLPPWGPDVRWDSHVSSGDVISPFYDSLVGKLIVYAETREECIKATANILDGMIIDGIKTTIPVCRKLMDNKDFIKGKIHTKYLEKYLASEEKK